MIGVFRIYLGRSWFDSDTSGALLQQFDSIGEFFYRTSAVDADEVAEADTPELRRAAVRVAMTQAHLVLLLAGDAPTDDNWTQQELQVARSGLRRSIPVLTVRTPTCGDRDSLALRSADHVVDWNAADMTCAIQQLVEAAALERRASRTQLDLADVADAQLRPTERKGPRAGEAASAAHARPARRDLPTTAIVEAFEALKSRRSAAAD